MNTDVLPKTMARTFASPSQPKSPSPSGLRGHMKRLFKKLPEGIRLPIEASRARKGYNKIMTQQGYFEVNRLVAHECGRQIIYGPFKDLWLNFTEELMEFDYTGAYTLGLYEKWLEGVYEDVLKGPAPTQCVIIGASGGVEAVAFALRFRTSHGVAFDTDWKARKVVRNLAAENRVKNLEVRGRCTKEWLRDKIVPNAFILSDCEGGEVELFGEFLPSFRSSTLLVEIHPHKYADAEERVSSAFARTHDIKAIKMDTSWADSPEIRERTKFLGDKWWMVAKDPLRTMGHLQSWLYMKPKA